MEEIVSGYCRCLDKSRMVMVEDFAPDCEYESCPHRPNCQIAKRITEILEAQK